METVNSYCECGTVCYAGCPVDPGCVSCMSHCINGIWDLMVTANFIMGYVIPGHQSVLESAMNAGINS